MKKASLAEQTSFRASATERFLGKYFAPCVLSKKGRIFFISVYAMLVGWASYGYTQLEIAFDIDYFISEESIIYSFNQANDKYFNKGGVTTVTYFENGELDYASEQS